MSSAAAGRLAAQLIPHVQLGGWKEAHCFWASQLGSWQHSFCSCHLQRSPWVGAFSWCPSSPALPVPCASMQLRDLPCPPDQV